MGPPFYRALEELGDGLFPGALPLASWDAPLGLKTRGRKRNAAVNRCRGVSLGLHLPSGNGLVSGPTRLERAASRDALMTLRSSRIDTFDDEGDCA